MADGDTRDVDIKTGITVVLQEFTYLGQTRERPIKVTATGLGNHTVHPRPTNAVPIATFHTGKSTLDATRPINMDYGHLIALELAGKTVNVPENVVLMNSMVNQRGDWRDLEHHMQKQTGVMKKAQIQVWYEWQDKRVPSRLKTTITETTDNVTNHPVANLKDVLPTKITVTAKFRKSVQKALDDFMSSGWTMRDWALKNEKMKLNIPDPPGPYAVLDYMWAELKTLEAPNGNIANGHSVASNQFDYIFQFNAMNNGGYLKSDSDTDVYKNERLSLDGSDTYPQVDHIVSKMRSMGCSAYSNLQILSGAANWSKNGTSV